ncbi:MAG: RidA family protein [Ilumatobacter sp.]|jgi:enamine deaminase RidA (YjgF/YER057c/UK114 family)|tara:strand:+ start:1287 stop:1739 length:453 start_codon:yes stop_codon:yes gene_type:complete
MTDITRLHTSERASKIVVHGGVAYLSGQVAEDPQADIQDQTRSTLGRVDDLLIDAGSDREHLLSVTIYLRDIDNDFALMNEVWNAWVPTGHAPARACLEAHMARSKLLVEICVTAAVINPIVEQPQGQTAGLAVQLAQATSTGSPSTPAD